MAEDTPFMLSLTDEDINLAREAGFDISKYLPDDAANRKGYRPVEQSDRETSWADWGRALVGVGGSQLIADTAGGIEYLTKGAIGGDTRRYFEGVSQEQAEALSPVFRRAFESEVIPEEGKASIFDNFALSLGAKTVAALPSVVSSIIPAGLAVKALQGASLATRVAAAGAAARGTAGLQAGGGVAGQIYSTIERMSDQELQDKAPIYAGYRSMMPEAEARRQYMNEVAGAAPAAAFLLTAALGGVEGQIAGRFAGEAARGVLRSAGRGALAEAAQETVESGGGELLTQLALADQNLAQMNWQKILSKGLEGGLVGGALGGGVGGISGFGRRDEAVAPPPPAPPATTGLDTAPDVVPPKGAGTGAAPQPASGPQIGDPNARPTGSETQYPKARDPLDISTVEKRLAAKNIPFPEDRREEFQARIEAIRGLTKNRQPEFRKFLNQLYTELAPAATPTGTQTIAPGVQVGTGPDAAQTAALGVSLPVKPIPPQVSAIVQRGPTPAPVAPTPPARTAPTLTPNVTAAMQRQTAPVDTGTNLQQPNADLLAEQKELISGQRAVQMFPKNTTPLPLPKGMKKSKTARGVFHYKPNATLPDGRKVTDGLIQQLSAAGRENELLGLGDRTKQEVAAAAPAEGGVTTVSEVTPEGARVRSVAATAADAERQAQMLQEEAAPENEVTIEPPAKALAPRVLEDVSPEGQAARAAAAAADEARRERIAAEELAKEREAASIERAAAVEGKVGKEAMLTKDEQRAAKIAEDEQAAAEVVANHPPTAAEANLQSKDGAERKAAMQAMYDRLKKMVSEAEKRGVSIPERQRKQADDLILLMRAKKFLAARAPAAAKGGLGTVTPYRDFVAMETSLRGGREAAAAERARAKGEAEAAMKPVGEAPEGTVSEERGTLSQAAEEAAMTPEERMLAAEGPGTLAQAAEDMAMTAEERAAIAEEVYASGRERELSASAAARAADEDAIRAIESQEGKFKVAKRPVAEKFRPTVTGKISLKPKAAAAVAVAKKAEAPKPSNVTRTKEDGVEVIKFGSLRFTLYGRGRGGGNQLVYRLNDKSYSIDLVKDPREGGQGLDDLPTSGLPEALHPIISTFVEGRINNDQFFAALKELEQQVQSKQLQPTTPQPRASVSPARVMADENVVFDTWESRQGKLEPISLGGLNVKEKLKDILDRLNNWPGEMSASLKRLRDELSADLQWPGRPGEIFTSMYMKMAEGKHLDDDNVRQMLEGIIPDLREKMLPEIQQFKNTIAGIAEKYRAENPNVITSPFDWALERLDRAAEGTLSPLRVMEIGTYLLRVPDLGMNKEFLEADRRYDNAIIELANDSGSRVLELPNYETGKPVVVDAFHGSAVWFDKFNKKYLGSFTKAGSAKLGWFFARNPKTTDTYIGRGSRRAVFDEYKMKEVIDALRGLDKIDETNQEMVERLGLITDNFSPEQEAEFTRLLDRYFDSRANKEPSYVRDRLWTGIVSLLDEVDPKGFAPNVRMQRLHMANPYVHDQGGKDYREETYYGILKKAQQGGHDGVIITNTFDGGPQDVIYVVFDEGQISDRFLPNRPEKQLFPSRGRILQRANYQPVAPTGPTVRMAGVDITPIQTTDVARTLRLTSDDLYAIFRDGPSRLFATFFKDRMTKRVGNIPVYVVTDEDMERMNADVKWNQPWLANTTVNGLYYDGKIALRASVLADPVAGLELAMHEALHAWSEDAINSNPKLQKALDELVDIGRLTYETYYPDRPSLYGLTDRYEFISEAFSSPDFRAYLASVSLSDLTRHQIEQAIGPVKGPMKNLWDAFIQMIRSAMGLGDTLANYTLLDAVMHAGARIDEIVERRGVIGDRLMKPRAAAAPRASVSAQSIINSSIDRKNAFNSWGKETWAKFITLAQMSDQYANTVIGPALKKISDAVLGTGPRIKALKETGDALAARAVDLSRKNPDEFRKLVDIMEQARMLDISIEGDNSHLGKDATKGWRGKALLPELQAQFASIQDGELKQLYRDMAEFYRNSHNDIVKANVTSILEGMQLRQTRGKAKGNALTDQEIADLTKRVMDKTMTDADKTLLGPTIYNALKNAADFHRVKGDYFPLMRYGDYVVVTEDKITDTMGGTLETPDTVLFRDKSNTAARRAAEELATKSELRPLSVDKTYFDNATGKEVTEDEAKSLNDVDIGYRVTLQTQGVYFFESRTQAEEFARTNPEGHDVIRSPEKRKGSGYQAQTMTGSQISAINKGIEGRVKSGDITEGQANLLKSIVNQSATRMLGGNRITSRRLKAMKVTGASKEIERNLLQYNAAASRAIAVSESAPVIRDAFVELDDQLKGYAGADRPQLVAVVEEAKARIEQGIVAPNEPGKVMKDVMSLVFLARLFSPAYSVINGMQVSMVTVPVLGGRFGNMAAATEVGKAYSDIGFGSAVMQGIYNTARAGKQIARATLVGTDDIVGNMRKKIAAASDGADLTSMMDELIRLNAIDVSAGLEVVASAAEGRGLWGRSIAAVDRIARQLPQMVEAINRTVTAVASYRLARKDGQTHEQATQFALKMVRDTQGDYSAANAPRFFNNPILRPALQFKKYAQMMSYLLGDMMYRAFNGATPEEKKIALKQLGNIIGVQILMAGALSLPGLEIIKAAFLITSLFGLTGGWDDQEDKFRKLLDASVGKKWSELISSGILSRAIGIDLSQRMSLADMWLFGEPKGDTSENWQAYLFRQLTGAPGGYVIDAIEAGRLFVEEGEYLKGIGKILPAKFAADFAKAAHNYREGKYEEEKRRSVSGVGEAALNVFGFRSGRQAEVGRERGVAIRERQDMQKEFKKLQREYYRARTKGEQIKAIAKNREWNEQLTKSQWRLRLPVKPRKLETAQ